MTDDKVGYEYEEPLDDRQGITFGRFLELVVIAIGSSVIILELIWTINDYRDGVA